MITYLYKKDNPLFSILICTLTKRKNIFENGLLCALEPQITDNTQIIINTDAGETSVGEKRNQLLEASNGSQFIAFFDDDDCPSDNYVPLICDALKQDPDCIGIEGIITFDGRNPRKFIHSKQFDHWFEKDNIFYRSPNHLNPVKRNIAVSVGFQNISHGEDSDYSSRLFPLLNSEIYISQSIYFYNFRRNK